MLNVKIERGELCFPKNKDIFSNIVRNYSDFLIFVKNKNVNKLTSLSRSKPWLLSNFAILRLIFSVWFSIACTLVPWSIIFPIWLSTIQKSFEPPFRGKKWSQPFVSIDFCLSLGSCLVTPLCTSVGREVMPKCCWDEELRELCQPPQSPNICFDTRKKRARYYDLPFERAQKYKKTGAQKNQRDASNANNPTERYGPLGNLLYSYMGFVLQTNL